jgi:hypothetical protein
MVIRTTTQLATIMAIRNAADEQNVRNGHTLSLRELPAASASNWQVRVHIGLRELGFTTSIRQARLEFLGELFGRLITSVKDLSWPECQSFCSALSINITRKDLEDIANDYKRQFLGRPKQPVF